MYDNLKSLGITNPDEIDRYSLRQEANNDILKIYFQKDKGEFFAKSVKFKYPRQRQTVVAERRPGLQRGPGDQPQSALRYRRAGSDLPARSH